MEKPVVWILGAGGGVGGCVAQQLSAAGWKIVGSGRDPEKFGEASQGSADWVSLPLDACDSQQMEAGAKKILEECGRLTLSSWLLVLSSSSLCMRRHPSSFQRR